MPKDKKPYIELHDAHVTAALDDRSEQHFRWMMEQDRPELSTEDQEWCDKLEDSWKDEWEKVDRDWEQLVRGAAGASDIVEYQRRVEELEARREEILADRRKLFESQTEEDGVFSTSEVDQALSRGPSDDDDGAKMKPSVTLAQSRWDRFLLKAAELRKDDDETTIEEIIKDPLVLQIWPSKKRPKESTLKRKLEGSGLTKRGRRKAE